MNMMRWGILAGLTLGLAGGLVGTNNSQRIAVHAQSNEATVTGYHYINIGKSQSLANLKEQLSTSKFDQGQMFDGDIFITNQTQISGHINEVLGPVIKELAKQAVEKKNQDPNNSQLLYGYLDTLSLENDNLTNRDLQDLVNLIKQYGNPLTNIPLFYSVKLGANYISDSSSLAEVANSVLRTDGLGQKYDSNNQSVGKVNVDTSRHAEIPISDISKLVPDYGYYHTELTYWQSVPAQGADPTWGLDQYNIDDSLIQNHFFEYPAQYDESFLNYSRNGWADFPYTGDPDEKKSTIDQFEQKSKDPKFVKKLEDEGWTVQTYEKYLKDRADQPSSLTVTNIPKDAKSIYLRFLINTGSTPDWTTILAYHLASSGSGSSSSSSSSSSSIVPPTPDSSSSSASSSSNSTPSTPDNPSSLPGTVYPIAKRNQAVYSIKKIYMYSNATFNKAQRMTMYANKPRINRPMFVVKGYLYSNSGRLRYKVQDVNHHSKTAGKTGYITSNWRFVRPVYYTAKHLKLAVINPQGINEYTNKNLTGKIKNHPQGTTLKVKSFVKHNLTTRYKLANGHYVTGNRKLVTDGTYSQPKKIKVKKSINLYRTLNLKKKVRHIKKGTVLKIKRWEYSQPYSMTTFGSKRYLIAGGYVTANSDYVKIIK